jgi:hypothetical protein
MQALSIHKGNEVPPDANPSLLLFERGALRRVHRLLERVVDADFERDIGDAEAFGDI